MIATKFQNRAAFSLVELVVSVAIVAGLAALLFPAASSILDRARSTKCAGNLRQIGIAVQSYLADNDGYYPPLGTDSSYWVLRLRPYLGISDPKNFQEATPKVFLCPSDKPTSPQPAWYSSYGLNCVFIQGGQGGVIPSVTKDVTVSSPSTTILLAETGTNNVYGGVIMNSRYGSSIGGRHGKHDSLNVLWFDQHVSMEKLTNITNSRFWGYEY